MKKSNIKNILLIILIGILIGITYLYTSSWHPIDTNNPYPSIEETSSLETLGFIAYWSIPNNVPDLDYIALFALTPTENGWVNLFPNHFTLPIQNSKLLWTLKIHSEDYTDWLRTSEEITYMIHKLAPYMNKSDGVVVNLEAWQHYIKLGEILKTLHDMYPNKILMVTLPSWGLPIPSNLYMTTDRFILMAYDYDFQNGILAPLDKVETSIKFYQNISSKLLLGIPLYGYQYVNGKYIAIPIELIETSSVTYTENHEAMASGKQGPVIWNNLETIERKIQLIHKYQLKGIALWTIGYTSETFIDTINKLIEQESTTSTR